MDQAQRFFWLLDNEVPATRVNDYAEAVGESKSSLADIVRLMAAKVPVVPQAYLTTEGLKALQNRPGRDFFDELSELIARLEHVTKARLGSEQYPLLLTVQGDLSGAVRNIGVSPRTLKGLVHHYGRAAAFTMYVDFLESFSTLVLACPFLDFRATFQIQSHREGGAGGLAALTEEDFLRMVREYQAMVSQKIGRAFPDKPEQQILNTLLHCAGAAGQVGGDEIFVRTQFHRGLGGQACKGVVYTRSPFTGKAEVYGVYESGEDGTKAPLEAEPGADAKGTLRDRFPSTYTLLKDYLPKVESVFRDIMEAEFVTDEDGHLFFTGFDKAQKTAKAGVVSAVELNVKGVISDKEACLRIKPSDIEVLLHPTLSDDSRSKLQDLGTTGVTAAPGTAVGHVFFRMDEAIEFYKNATKQKKDNRIILVCDELLISDTPGLSMTGGLVTKAAGIASHAAVMARANGIPCIVGFKGLEIDSKNNRMVLNGKEYGPGILMTMEAGSEGRMYIGEGKLQNMSHQEGVVQQVSQLVSRVCREEEIPLEIRVNINNAKDAATGLSFGADAVGLCRTENMFIKDEALWEIRNIVFSQDLELSRPSLERLEELQFEDFKKIFKVMHGKFVSIRLMDVPLHELAPQTEADFRELESRLKHLDKMHLHAVAEGLKEHNPMLGLRACRFGITVPAVYDMQIRAIIRAGYAIAQEGFEVKPGIMFPMVFAKEELSRMRDRVFAVEEEIRAQLRIPASKKIAVKVGTMIELPAAALAADKLAQVGEFFAFGTNDLTQTTLGISRDDSAHYLPTYIEKGIIDADPFKQLCGPVKELIEIAVKRGKRVKKRASFGICGEQGGDPTTLTFALGAGLEYVSASPFRVLSSKVALVHTALAMRERGEIARDREREIMMAA